MRILVTGRGTSGSWKIRGEQLGAAIGATVIPKAESAKGFDLAVLVKKPEPQIVNTLQRARVPIVWDVIDAWPQPEGNSWPEAQCIAWLRTQIDIIRPIAVVASTWAMRSDIIGAPSVVVPHHARPGMARNPIRENVSIVGYEGGVRYIEQWRPIVERECARRGWTFVVNPPALADVDIVLGLRDYDGYAARHWKSGVKLSNAQGSGTPFVGCREAGYLEQSTVGCERWADTEAELRKAFDDLAPQEERRRVSGWMFAVAPSLRSVADAYRNWLEEEDLCCMAGKS